MAAATAPLPLTAAFIGGPFNASLHDAHVAPLCDAGWLPPDCLMPNAAHWGTPAAAAAGGPDVALRMPAAVDGFFAEELPPDARTPQNVLWMSRMVPFEEDTRSLLHVTLLTPTASTLWIVGISERCNMSVGGSGGGGALVPYSYVEITDETSCAVFVAIGGDALTVLPRGSRMSPSEPFLRLGAQGAPPDAGCGPQAIPLLLVPERRRRECSGHGSCRCARARARARRPLTRPHTVSAATAS